MFISKKHIDRRTVLQGLGATVALPFLDAMVPAATAQSATAAKTPTSSLPLVMFAMAVFSLLLGPLQNAISRHYERQCDRYALSRTGLRDAYRSAFNKLARLNKDDPEPNSLEVFLLHSHPPIAERLAMADA